MAPGLVEEGGGAGAGGSAEEGGEGAVGTDGEVAATGAAAVLLGGQDLVGGRLGGDAFEIWRAGEGQVSMFIDRDRRMLEGRLSLSPP